MDYKIIKIGPGEVEEVHEILGVCGLDMKMRFGFGHWDPPYPLHLLRKSAEEKSVYIVRAGGFSSGTFTIGTQAPDYYDMSLWADPEEKAVYVSRLAVLPEFQGRGVGSWCMAEIERMAAETGCGAVRLDTIQNHVRQQNFYEKLNYLRRGTIRFREDALVCFEKVLSGK